MVSDDFFFFFLLIFLLAFRSFRAECLAASENCFSSAVCAFVTRKRWVASRSSREGHDEESSELELDDELDEDESVEFSSSDPPASRVVIGDGSG